MSKIIRREVEYGRYLFLVVFGEAGNDVLWLDEGNDTALGGDGNDFISGDRGWSGLYNPANAGQDFIDGGAGNGSLISDDGADVIFGGSDNDILVGDRGGVSDDSTKQRCRWVAMKSRLPEPASLQLRIAA